MARSTLPRSIRPGAARPAPVVRDFRGASAGYRIVWDPRTAYDFLFSLSDDAGSTDDLPAADRRWLTEARAAFPESIAADRTRLFESDLCIQIAELIVDQPSVHTAADFVSAVGALDRAAALRYMASEVLRDDATTILATNAANGDSTALAELAESIPEHQREAQIEIIRDLDGVLGRLKTVLEAWQRPFSEIEPRVLAMLVRDVEDRAEDARTLPPGDLIEKTTGGLRYTPEPNIRRVVLAPSYFSRPYNFLFSGKDWRLYGYPIADSALDSTDPLEPPPAVVRLHRALGDPSRLRILRVLADGDRYLTEIAQLLELSKPTVKHHMAQLRAAGLVTLTEEGSLTYYSLRRDRLDEVGADLRHFITT